MNSVGSVLEMFTTLCHEMAHDGNSAGTHNHGPEFFEKYYNVTKQRYYSNPLFNVYKFSEVMDRNKIEEKRSKEEKKEMELQETLHLASSS
jgi:hypothetical protein